MLKGMEKLCDYLLDHHEDDPKYNSNLKPIKQLKNKLIQPMLKIWNDEKKARSEEVKVRQQIKMDAVVEDNFEGLKAAIQQTLVDLVACKVALEMEWLPGCNWFFCARVCLIALILHTTFAGRPGEWKEFDFLFHCF